MRQPLGRGPLVRAFLALRFGPGRLLARAFLALRSRPGWPLVRASCALTSLSLGVAALHVPHHAVAFTSFAGNGTWPPHRVFLALRSGPGRLLARAFLARFPRFRAALAPFKSRSASSR